MLPDRCLKAVAQMQAIKRSIPAITIFAAGSFLLTACSNETDDHNDRIQDNMERIHTGMRETETHDSHAFESDRQDLLNDLRDLRADINDDLEDSEIKLADPGLDPEKRERHHYLRRELMHHREIVEHHLDRVEAAEPGQWDALVQESQHILASTGQFYNDSDLQRRRAMDTARTDQVNANPQLDLNRNAEEVR